MAEGESTRAGSRGRDAGCNQILATPLQNDPRQGAWRRTRQYGAISDRKESPVAGAGERALFGAIEDHACLMRAEAAVGDVFFRVGANEDARIFGARILEYLRAADRDFSHVSYHDLRIGS